MRKGRGDCRDLTIQGTWSCAVLASQGHLCPHCISKYSGVARGPFCTAHPPFQRVSLAKCRTLLQLCIGLGLRGLRPLNTSRQSRAKNFWVQPFFGIPWETSRVMQLQHWQQAASRHPVRLGTRRSLLRSELCHSAWLRLRMGANTPTHSCSYAVFV